MRAEDHTVFRFDEFCLDTTRGTLRGPGGAELVLRPKGIALLRYLLERPGVLHAREALLDALWPGLAVTDDSLTQCVGDLRRALGDRATAVLRTLPRRGYMLATPVRREAASPSPPVPTPTPTGAAAAMPLDGDLLVLEALEPASDDAEGRRVARVLDAELLAAFSQSEMIAVQARTATPLPPESYHLSGAVRLAGAEPLLSLRLMEADTGRILWADQVTLPPPGRREEALAFLFARLEALVNGEARRRARRKPPEALRAYDFVRLGYALYGRGEAADVQEAEQHLLRAIAMDPGIAVAHAYRALILIRRAMFGLGEQEVTAERRQALDCARRAVELKPRSGLCLAALAYALAIAHQWDAALENARTAVGLSTLSAISARTTAASALAISGAPEEAVDALQATIALDPFCPPGPRHVLGTALLLAGRQAEALVELRRAALHMPNFASCLRSLLIVAAEMGQIEEARQALVQLRHLKPSWLSDPGPSLSFMRDQGVVDRYRNALAACAEA